ncbi:semaphorin-7A isoform X2 [Syngnathoides biaculeatus]|uniref:semaphorin-7A isoform X2 n=1 Tax=Syngnathoides biaculeatus TaxID=300417 RepID=UPI002ADE7F96|nr:semaphorin-7A isoform X2 [Syngnathoides biaculeatus]
MSSFLSTLYCYYFLILWLLSSVNSGDPWTLLPRMTFTREEITLENVTLPGEIRTVLLSRRDHRTLLAVGKSHLIFVSFQDPPKTPVERKLLWAECTDTATSSSVCSYKVVLAHEREDASRVFLCGTDGAVTLCCDTLSEVPPTCTPADDLDRIRGSIRNFVLKDAEHSVLVESAEGSALYVTYSGSKEYVGVHKFGKYRVGPANHDKEQHYLRLVLSKHRDEPLQDKVYAFYKERNKDLNVFSSTWLPFVSQFCLADMGGPKNNLQFTWTSQMSARLFCGDPESKKHFFEMVDIVSVDADRWQDTRIYALFRNEWNMSAVCVYSVQDIHDVFSNSPFKGSENQVDRPRVCVSESTYLPLAVLKMTKQNSEMEHWVKPVKKSGPLLISHHVYTHIHADAALTKEHTLLFLSRNSGGVDKMIHNASMAFIVAEYRPFTHRAHIDSILLHPTTKNLYISSSGQLVQMDVADCTHYGNTCEDCVLARDPYCSWDDTRCTAATSSSGEVVQDVDSGNYHLCSSSHLSSKVVSGSSVPEVALALPHGSQYLLKCPLGSRHAHYSWHHSGSGDVPCARNQHGCPLLIDSEEAGEYTCRSEERGYSRVLARYVVTGGAASAGCSTGLLIWVCALTAVTCTRWT